MWSGQTFFEPERTAWVDLPSNFAWLPNVRPEHAASLIKGRVPTEIIQTVIHETTHHWCFWTVVGEAMSLVRHRAQLGLLRLTLGQDVNDSDIACDIARYEVVERALAPIIEGMALAMEHDATNGGSDTIYCRPLHQYHALLTEEMMEDSYFLHLRDVDRKLMKVRTSEAGLTRKLNNILSMPLDVTKSVYLLGYLAAKAYIVGQNMFFKGSSDMALSYMKSYFFDDYGLIATMFGDDPHNDDPVRILERVGNYLVRRVDALFRNDLASGVAAWEPQVPEPLESARYKSNIDLGNGVIYPLWITPTPGIDVTPADEKKGYTRHRELIQDLEVTGEDALIDGHQQNGLQMLFMRPLMPISSTPVTLFQLGDEVEARDAEKRPLGRLRPVAKFTDGSEAVLDFLSVPSKSLITAAAFVDGTIVAHATHGPENMNVLSSLKMMEPTPRQREALERTRESHDELVKKKLATLALLERARSQYKNVQNAIWRPAASIEIAQVENWKSALEQLDEIGFVRMFRSNRTAGFDVARLSLIASGPVTREELTQAFSEAGRDFKATMTLVDDIRERRGLSLVMETTDDRIVSLV
jgi:hypothetical protein